MNPPEFYKGKGWRAVVPLLSYLMRMLVLLLRESNRFDVLIVSGVKIIPLAVVPVCLITGKKCILRAESFFELHEAVSAESMQTMHRISGRGIGAFADRIRRFMIRRADYVIAISDQIRAQMLAREVAEARIRQIPNAVDTEKFHPVSAEEKTSLAQQARLALQQNGIHFFRPPVAGKGLADAR